MRFGDLLNSLKSAQNDLLMLNKSRLCFLDSDYVDSAYDKLNTTIRKLEDIESLAIYDGKDMVELKR